MKRFASEFESGADDDRAGKRRALDVELIAQLTAHIPKRGSADRYVHLRAAACHVLCKHRPCICARQVYVKILEWAIACDEVTIAVRRTEHLPFRCNIFIVTPLLRLVITTPLHRYARLETRIAA